jgi:hypothetical protein
MAKQIDLQAQNAVAVRTDVKDRRTSANGKSAPSTFEAWSIHMRALTEKNEVILGKKLGSTTLRRQAGKWSAIVGGLGGSYLGEVARLLATLR